MVTVLSVPNCGASFHFTKFGPSVMYPNSGGNLEYPNCDGRVEFKKCGSVYFTNCAASFESLNYGDSVDCTKLFC